MSFFYVSCNFDFTASNSSPVSLKFLFASRRFRSRASFYNLAAFAASSFSLLKTLMLSLRAYFSLKNSSVFSFWNDNRLSFYFFSLSTYKLDFSSFLSFDAASASILIILSCNSLSLVYRAFIDLSESFLVLSSKTLILSYSALYSSKDLYTSSSSIYFLLISVFMVKNISSLLLSASISFYFSALSLLNLVSYSLTLPFRTSSYF